MMCKVCNWTSQNKLPDNISVAFEFSNIYPNLKIKKNIEMSCVFEKCHSFAKENAKKANYVWRNRNYYPFI